MVGDCVSSALANARAYEEERKRAEALAEIDRSKTVFFSNISHEFRTPLTLMLGPLEDTLTEGGLPPEARDRLEVARRNSLRLLKLVNTLLDFSRIVAARALDPTGLRGEAYVEDARRWLPGAPRDIPSEGAADDHLLEDLRRDSLSDLPQAGQPVAQRILLADDNADMREYVRRLLGGQYEVEAVADGEAALNAVRESAPDLVLTHVMIPNLY